MSHKTRDKLRETPFATAEELKLAQLRIREEVWLDIERSRIFRELAALAENEFLLAFFRQPWCCFLEAHAQEILSVRLSQDQTPKIVINEKLYKSTANKDFIESILRALLGEFASSYLDVTKIRASGKQDISHRGKKE